MIGQQYKTMHCGTATVVEYKNRDNVTVEFETGYRLVTTKDVLTKSKTPRLRDPLAKTVFGVGRIGVGPHKAHAKGADTKAFSIWRAMLRRCYYRGAKHHQKSYEGKTVCPQWHDFQTFAAWFEVNYPTDGGAYQLDKDIKAGRSDTYSPETCSFVTLQQNLAARRAGKFCKGVRVL